LRIAFRTDAGRDPGEKGDAFLCRDNLFVVAEGLGGEHLSEIAKGVACQAISHAFFRYLQGVHSPGEAILLALHHANKEILGERRKTGIKMAASVSVVYITGNIMYFTHLGDSRIYSLRGGEIAQITKDHTIREEDPYVDPGRDDPRMMGALTEGLGIREDPDIMVKKLALHERELILMTTEGLTSRLPNKEILRLSLKERNVDRLCSTLIDTARRRGGGDREMTAGVIRYVKDPRRRRKWVPLYASAVLLLLLLALGGYDLFLTGHESREEGTGEIPRVPEKTVQAEKAVRPEKTVPPEKTVRAEKPASADRARPQPGPRPEVSGPEKDRGEARAEVFLDEEIRSFLAGWKGAWEGTARGKGGIGRYISCYSDGFVSKGLDKEGWRRDKERKGRGKKWIEVKLTDIRTGAPGEDDRVQVRFRQHYRSSNYSGISHKVLVLRKEGAEWKILAERAD
jgi:serine/threonine protein phosphatase PrpC